jgi:hypothetical protein
MPFGEYPPQSPSLDTVSLDTVAEGSLFLPSLQAIYPPSAHPPASAARCPVRSKSHMIWGALSCYDSDSAPAGWVGRSTGSYDEKRRQEYKSTMRPIRNRAMDAATAHGLLNLGSRQRMFSMSNISCSVRLATSTPSGWSPCQLPHRGLPRLVLTVHRLQACLWIPRYIFV